MPAFAESPASLVPHFGAERTWWPAGGGCIVALVRNPDLEVVPEFATSVAQKVLGQHIHHPRAARRQKFVSVSVGAASLHPTGEQKLRFAGAGGHEGPGARQGRPRKRPWRWWGRGTWPSRTAARESQRRGYDDGTIDVRPPERIAAVWPWPCWHA